MRIDLFGPYGDAYRLGYLRESPDGRKRVDLFNSNEDRTTVSYARYLLSIKHNRFLTDEEEADHIDNDCTNDHIDNLQILPYEEHKEKTLRFRKPASIVVLVCPVCKESFERVKRQVKVAQPKCSRRCNGIASTTML